MADLFASDVKTSSLTVEIKSLHVGTKQMSLSVFRQIHEEDLFDNKLNLLGKPFGIVNYYWDKADQFNKTVIHIVWQKGEYLRRFRFSDIVPGHDMYGRGLHFEGTLRSRHYGKQLYELERVNDFLEGKKPVLIEHEEIHCHKHYEKDGVLSLMPNPNNDKWISERNAKCEQKYKQSKELEKEHFSRKIELEKSLSERQNQAELHIKKWKEVYSFLSSLPQLYIAA